MADVSSVGSSSEEDFGKTKYFTVFEVLAKCILYGM